MPGPEYERKVLLTAEEIQAIVLELAMRIYNDYFGKELSLVVILDGAFMFAADLMRQIARLRKEGGDTASLRIEFMKVSSYGLGQESSGDPQIILDVKLEAIDGRHVLIVEDLIDSGHTLAFLIKHFAERENEAAGPISFAIVTLLAKLAEGAREVEIKYVGREIDGDKWVEGYGMDMAGEGRGSLEIVEVVEIEQEVEV